MLCRFDVETTSKNPREELINISSILKVEPTSKLPRRIDVIISTWIRLSKSMLFCRTFQVEFQSRIDGESTRICPLVWWFSRRGKTSRQKQKQKTVSTSLKIRLHKPKWRISFKYTFPETKNLPLSLNYTLITLRDS